MAGSNDVVIIAGCRTPIGRFQGSLSDLTAPQLGAIAVREAVKRANLDPKLVDECIMGNVVSAGLGQNPARQAAIFGGLAPEVGAMTINKVCGSGLKSVALAAQAIETGNSSIVVAGGMESMTNAPYLLPNARKGYRLGNGATGRLHGARRAVGHLTTTTTWECTGENCRREIRHHPRRAGRVRGELAPQSHRRPERMPFQVADRAGGDPRKEKGPAAVMFDKDEGPREDTTIEVLRALKPAFKKDGTVTAGNAPGVNDGGRRWS